MLASARVVVIDDDPEHLRGLVDALASAGASCLAVHFTGITEFVQEAPHVRLVFADLHLNESGAGGSEEQHYSVIGGLLEETLRPNGPYAVILWTRYSDKAAALADFLERRLQAAPPPFAVVAIDKLQHIDGTNRVKDPQALVQAIATVLNGQAEVSALMAWEQQVLGAAAQTVSGLVNLVRTSPRGDRTAHLQRLFGHLATEAVGPAHVERDRMRAINEALLPILADSVASLRGSPEDDERWKNVLPVTLTQLAPLEAAKLNRLLHIALDDSNLTAADRGVVSTAPPHLVPKADGLHAMSLEDAAEKQFGCKRYADVRDSGQWLLIQAQAACDFAQSQPGPIPFVLGFEARRSSFKSKGVPGALWYSPSVELEGEERALAINFRFGCSLRREDAATLQVRYRIRESLLNDLVFRMHSYGARPGFISFRSG